ncbi:NADPH:quinone oxidoreductase family protein [soil metagenome]
MRALVVERLAPDFAGCAVRDLETPTPGPGEVRIAVRAASVNFPDLLMTKGEYQFKPPLPFIPGLDLSGVIDAVGDGVSAGRIGEAVVAGARTGGFAQFAVVPASAARAKPDRLSFAQGAAYGAAYLTAYVALVRRAQLKPGETLLVQGASGGVGLAAVDLAKALGAVVIAASASDEKLAVVQAEYAPDAVLNVTGGFRERLKALTGGRGADVIYDPVGGDVFEESLRCLAVEGRLLVVGFASGRIGVAPANLALIKSASILGVRAGEYGRLHPELGVENLAAVDALAATGAVRPRVHAVVPLEHWREAFEMLSTRRVIGKAVIEL